MRIKIKDSKQEALETAQPAKTRSVKKSPKAEMHENSQKRKTNVHYILYFLAAVFVCIIFALIFRTAVMVKNSTFSTPSYSVLVSSNTPFIIAVNTESKKLSLIEIDTDLSRTRIQKSMQLKTPIDGKIDKKSGELYVDEYPSVGFFMSMLLRPWEYEFEGMTMLDALKLTQYALGIQNKDVQNYRLYITSDGEVEGISSSELYDTFKDPRLINEQESIEVVNGTGREGLAGQASLLLKNTGGNVVSLGTVEGTEKSSLKASKNSNTLMRISRILGISPEIDENFSSISDIKIVLGQDFVKRIE